MEINKVTAKEYSQAFPKPWSLFNSVAFSELNKEKCIDVHYLLFRDSKLRLGMIVGEKEDGLHVPFSAPYGGFSFNSSTSVTCYEEACASLKEYAKQIGKPLFITMASLMYNSTDNVKLYKALVQCGAKVAYTDINQHFDVARFAHYEALLDSKIRNKLRNALSGDLTFTKLDSKNPDDVARAYEVIRTNHAERGFPLHMSLQNVLDTIRIIPADFFVVSDAEGHDVAAAQIFHAVYAINQVIYWGDVPSYSHLRSMNFLAYKVFEYYYNQGEIRILDIGTSSLHGEPNYGLCEFKENIGCEMTLKYTLEL